MCMIFRESVCSLCLRSVFGLLRAVVPTSFRRVGWVEASGTGRVASQWTQASFVFEA